MMRILSIAHISTNGQGSRINALVEVQRTVPLELMVCCVLKHFGSPLGITFIYFQSTQESILFWGQIFKNTEFPELFSVSEEEKIQNLGKILKCSISVKSPQSDLVLECMNGLEESQLGSYSLDILVLRFLYLDRFKQEADHVMDGHQMHDGRPDGPNLALHQVAEVDLDQRWVFLLGLQEVLKGNLALQEKHTGKWFKNLLLFPFPFILFMLGVFFFFFFWGGGGGLESNASCISKSDIIFHSLIQWKLSITRSLGPRNFVCYIRYFVISVVNKQYKTKQIDSLGPEKIVCYIRYLVIADVFISSFHCILKIVNCIIIKHFMKFLIKLSSVEES